MKDNKNSIYMILGAIVIVLIMVASFILGTKFANKDNENTNETYNNVVTTITQEEEDYLAAMIPEYIAVTSDGYNIYQNKLITVDELSSEQLSISVYYELIANYDEEIVGSASYDEFDGEPNREDYTSEDDYYLAYEQKCIEGGNLYYDYCYVSGIDPNGWDAYSEETIERIYHILYGENYNYVTPKYIGYFAEGCSYQDGYYFCGSGGGFGPGGEYDYNVVVASEKKDGQIYLYEDYLYVDDVCDADYENCISYVYTDSTKTTKIGEVSADEDAYETFADSVVKYKHTYKQNSDGTYYWYSVEPVTE